MKQSRPEPFNTMPIVYKRAFGGTDASHPDERQHRSELRNLIGRGYRDKASRSHTTDSRLPNFENPDDLMRSWKSKPAPIGIGAIARGWSPRIQYAGNYDGRWLKEEFPFYPRDFESRFDNVAPEDQQFDHFQGGEQIECRNMNQSGRWVARIPRMDIQLLFQFNGEMRKTETVLDTIVVEPDQNRILAVWRGSTPLGKKLTDLRGIEVGADPVVRNDVLREPIDAPHRFHSLYEMAAWQSRYYGTRRS